MLIVARFSAATQFASGADGGGCGMIALAWTGGKAVCAAAGKVAAKTRNKANHAIRING